MSYKDESNKNIGFLLISIGLLALFSGIDNIFNIDEYKPDFQVDGVGLHIFYTVNLVCMANQFIWFLVGDFFCILVL